MTEILNSAEDIATHILDGALLALPPEYAPCSMEGIRALVRRRARNLRLLSVPQFGFQADLLIGAGCVAEVESAGVTLGELGLAPRFTDAIENQKIIIRDSTCPAIHAALQASEQGVPFMPLRGLIGSDILARRDDWAIADNPFGDNDPIVYLPAIRPDAALFHAAKADTQGNVWIGVRRELMVMAHASASAYVTVEEIVESDLLDDPQTAPGAIPALYITAIAKAEKGAWPLGVPHLYERDRAHLALYEEMARDEKGFSAYLDKWVMRKTAPQ